MLNMMETFMLRPPSDPPPSPGRHGFPASEREKSCSGATRVEEGSISSPQELACVNAGLRETSRLKDEFLALLSHELRNPLSAILNAVALMRSADRSSADQSTDLLACQEIIERQTRQLARLVDDLLDLSRINQGKFQLQLEVVDLNLIVPRAVQAVRQRLDARQHQLTVSIPSAPCWVEGDASRLEQVLVNLLTNAAKYTELGGLIRLFVVEEVGRVSVRIQDNGHGIAPELLPHLFEPFVQSEHTLKAAQGGMGLGLCLVQRLVEMHGGRVVAQSAGVGRGSEFSFHLPATGKKPPGDNSCLECNLHTRHRILVVEDNVDTADTLRMLLELYGHTVWVAYEGEQAIREALARKPNVVLLDIGLPRLDGYAVARRLRTEESLPRTTLVALTGHGYQDDKERAREAGFDYHLTKPIDPVILDKFLAELPRGGLTPEPQDIPKTIDA